MKTRVVVVAAAAALALAGPLLAGRAEAPSAMASAAQLLPPGARVAEVALEGGGFVRAPRLERVEGGLTVGRGSAARTLPLATTGPIVERRLWFGTDQQGRDLLARTAAGARAALLLAALASAVALALGGALGLVMGLARPALAATAALCNDALLALPRLLLVLGLGLALGDLPAGVALALGLASFMDPARVVAAAARSARSGGLLDGARAAGAAPLRVALRHVLPALRPVFAASLPLVAAEAVLLEATLSYLGAPGTSPASWGRIVADGQRLLPSGWWIAILPGLLLAALVLALHAAVADRGRLR